MFATATLILLASAIGSQALCNQWDCPGTDAFGNALSTYGRDTNGLICDYGNIQDATGVIRFESMCTYSSAGGNLITSDPSPNRCMNLDTPKVYSSVCPAQGTDGTLLAATQTINEDTLQCTYGTTICEYDVESGDRTLDGGAMCPTSAGC